jgi:hypothetical protein
MYKDLYYRFSGVEDKIVTVTFHPVLDCYYDVENDKYYELQHPRQTEANGRSP